MYKCRIRCCSEPVSQVGRTPREDRESFTAPGGIAASLPVHFCCDETCTPLVGPVDHPVDGLSRMSQSFDSLLLPAHTALPAGRIGFQNLSLLTCSLSGLTHQA